MKVELLGFLDNPFKEREITKHTYKNNKEDLIRQKVLGVVLILISIITILFTDGIIISAISFLYGIVGIFSKKLVLIGGDNDNKIKD